MSGKIVYGVNAVREALRDRGRVNRLYIAKDTRVRDMDVLLDAAKAAGIPFDFVPQAKLNELAETHDHQGMIAAISPIGYTPLNVCLAQCPKRALLLVLDQVQNPANLGMLIRAAVGSGASAVVLAARGGALLDDDVVRASAGAVFHVPIATCHNVAQALRDIKEAGFWVYALEPAEGVSIFEMNWAGRTALVVGNETSGIRPGVHKAADQIVTIPLAGGLDSLNVAVAAGIALFQVAAKNKLAEV